MGGSGAEPWVRKPHAVKPCKGRRKSKRMILTADRPAPKTDDDLGGEYNPETTQSTVLRLDRQLRGMSSASAFAASLSPIAGNYCERPSAKLWPTKPAKDHNGSDGRTATE